MFVNQRSLFAGPVFGFGANTAGSRQSMAAFLKQTLPDACLLPGVRYEQSPPGCSLQWQSFALVHLTLQSGSSGLCTAGGLFFSGLVWQGKGVVLSRSPQDGYSVPGRGEGASSAPCSHVAVEAWPHPLPEFNHGYSEVPALQIDGARYQTHFPKQYA